MFGGRKKTQSAIVEMEASHKFKLIIVRIQKVKNTWDKFPFLSHGS